jgi:phosphatidate cytidylyltransferase
MKRVLTAVVLIPVVLLVVFRAPLWLFALLVAAIISLALREYLNVAEAAGIKPFRRLTYAVGLFPPLILLVSAKVRLSMPPRQFESSYFDATVLSVLAVLLPVVFGIPLVFRGDLRGGLVSSASSAFGVLYISVSLSLLILFRRDPLEYTLIVFTLFSVWAGDIAAYYVGRTFGRHKLAPVVSPNKSWEGAVASVIASVLVAIVVFHFHQQIRSWFTFTWTFYTPLVAIQITLANVITIGVLTNVAAQFGDLFESALKRGAGVKDSGTLLPGHGGMLDRIDALLFAIPVVWYYANLTGFLQPKFLP